MQRNELLKVNCNWERIYTLLSRMLDPDGPRGEFTRARYKKLRELRNLSFGLADSTEEKNDTTWIALIAEQYVREHIEEVVNDAVQMILLESLLSSLPNPVPVATLQRLADELVLKPMRKRLSVRTRGGDTRTKHKMSIEKRKQFTSYFHQYHQEWKGAGRLCKQVNKQSAKGNLALEAVSEKYPDLPEDLIHQLCKLEPYESTPARLALEHAARLCGIPANTYTPRRLRKFLLPQQPEGISLDELKEIVDSKARIVAIEG